MRIALGSDHWGVALKARVIERLRQRPEGDLECHDFGPSTDEAVDYPDYAAKVAEGVASGDYDRGILICASGIGMAMAANKVHGVRAASIDDAEAARATREHNDANILALGARRVSDDEALAIIDAFLTTPFGGGRHQRRVDKIAEIEGAQAGTLHDA